MKTKRFLNLFLAICLVLGGLATAAPHSVAAQADGKGVSPEGMLNPDGTLKLDGVYSGALDLEGYDVQLDPARGPVFTPLAAQENWDALAEGGGAFASSITTIVVNGTDVYVGGDFQNAADNPEADYIAKWDGSQWSALGNNGSGNGALNGTVYDMEFYGGALFVGGNFSTYDPGGVPIADATYLAVWDGAWMEVTGVTSPLNGTVYALGFDAANNILYFGGAFINVNGDGTADRLAGIDFDTSALVTLGNDGGGNGSLSNNVYAIGLDSGGNVYAGGFFTDVNNGGTSIPEADYIAKWDGSNWSALGNNGAGVGALNGLVTAIAIDGSNNVYAGGNFTDAAGVATADYIAKWNGSAWSALGSDGSGNGALVAVSNGSVVQEIVINGSDIYVGGFFTGSSGIPTADYAARFDTGSNTWHGLGSDGSGNGALKYSVTGLAYSGGDLYLGGYFYDVNNGGAVLPTADYFAIWDGSGWSTLGDSNGGLNQTVKTIAKIGADVYVGGSFYDLGGDPRMDFLVRWDGSAWNPVGNLTQIGGSLNSQVEALAVDGTNLYVGGYFTSAQNEGSSVSGTGRIAKWNGSAWSALGGGVNSAVFALAVDSSHNVYAGGNFTDAASIAEADYIAMWNGSAWSALAGNGAGNGALNSYVSALAVSGSNVYAGGNFTVVDISNTAIPNAARLAKWNGSAWSAMDGITSPVNSFVIALAISGSDLYVGGQFSNLNGMAAADKIAKWNGSTWSALGSNGFGEGSLTGAVHAIVVDGGSVYVGGTFTNVNNGGTYIPEADYVAKWDGSNWSALGNNGGGDGSLNSYVYALKVIDSDLWTGGSFTNVNNGGTVIKEADFLAAYGLDVTPPTVSSITRVNPNPTSTASVDFTVTFSESVQNVDTLDFTLTKTGSISGEYVTSVTGSGSTRTVTVNTGSGNGTLRLDMPGSALITDLSGNGLSNIPYTSGETYIKTSSVTFYSTGAHDGHILESTETSGVGGTRNNTATTFRIGDDASDRQYRAILHFDTSSLPDTAVITKATLRIREHSVIGSNPFSILGSLRVDMIRPDFGAPSLQLSDFSASAPRVNVGSFNTSTPWHSANLNNAARVYISRTGTTQVRLYFSLDDNDNGIADYIRFFSGDASSTSQPKLIILYYVP